jgi:Rnl2 family RNA ligase
MFKKYPSIDNHYQEKAIQRWVSMYPSLLTERYAVSEKIHGTNVQLVFDRGQLSVASRNRVLDPDENFFNVRGVVKADPWPTVCEMFLEYTRRRDCVVNLYGELFGPGIQKGVDYGPEKRILLFDMAEDGYLLPQKNFLTAMLTFGIIDLAVRPMQICGGIEAALAFNCDLPSTLREPEHFPSAGEYLANVMEGVVIKPYEHVYISPVGETFLIKKKNKAFAEKAERPRRERKEREGNPVVDSLREEFLRYITEARVENVFSRHGVIEEHSQIGDYIKLVIEDAKEEFLKETDVPEELEAKDLKQVYNVGKAIVPILMRRL